MTRAELEWIKERRAACLPPKPAAEPEQKPQPVPAPIDADTYTLDLYGGIIARSELAT
jgi:hypothetical protein